MRKKPIAIIGSILLLFAGVGFSIWISSFMGMSILNVSSDEAISYTSFLETDSIDATDNSAIVTDYVTITNTDGNASVSIDLVTIKTDIADTCTDYEDDVNVSITPLDFTLEKDELRNVTLVYDVKKWACPQEINATVSIETTPIEE